MLDNRPDFFLHWLALNACGVSVVPLNPDLRPAELDYLIAHSGLSRIVFAEPHRPAAEAAIARAPHSIQPSPSGRGEGEGIGPRPSTQELDQATECALLYTSGTTGRPKGCVLTNDYFLRAGRWYAEAGGLCTLQPGTDRLLTPLPMVHMNAMAFSTMAMILTGGCIVPLDRFHPRSWWDSVRQSRATIVHYLGVVPSMLLSLPATPADRGHAVRFGFGAGVDRRHHAVFEQRFGFPCWKPGP